MFESGQHCGVLVADSVQDGQHDHLNLQEHDTDNLAKLPPEVCQIICQMLPSSSLYSLPTISTKLCILAKMEMNIRHNQLKEKVLISRTSTILSLHRTVSMLCPGLVMIYSPTTSPTPPHHTHTTILRLLRSIFTSISPQTCQALSVPHFSATTPLTMNTITPPKCYQLLSLPMCSTATSVLLFSIPVDHPNIQKVRTFSSWNICLPHQEGQSVSSILPPAGCSRICLSGNSQVALLTLAKEMLGIKPDLSLMMDPMMDTLNMYKDPNTLVVVMTDPDSDPAIQLVLQTFFAKIFLPLKLSWVKMVFTHTEKEG